MAWAFFPQFNCTPPSAFAARSAPASFPTRHSSSVPFFFLPPAANRRGSLGGARNGPFKVWIFGHFQQRQMFTATVHRRHAASLSFSASRCPPLALSALLSHARFCFSTFRQACFLSPPGAYLVPLLVFFVRLVVSSSSHIARAMCNFKGRSSIANSDSIFPFGQSFTSY